MDKIIGHKEQIKKLQSIIENNTLSNAYIFSGIEGIGKATIAKKFAEKILNNKEYILIEPEEGLIKVDTIRALKEELLLKPTISDRKIAIINNAECMNEQAQNALLKILEEPPSYATIILITSSKEKLLYTIRSRCVDFKFNPLSKEEVQSFFEEQLSEELLDFCMGSIGEVKSALECESIEIVKRWVNIFKKTSLIEMMKGINTIKEDKYVKENMQMFLKRLLYYYYMELKNGDISVIKAISIIEEASNNILKNANIDIAIDRMAINLWKWGKECKKL